MEKEIELSPAEISAYWWVNVIRSKVKEILLYKSKRIEEIKFAEIFKKYTEKDWRNLYLQLSTLIIEDINNLENTGDIYFEQNTTKGKHKRLNEELSKITHKSVPDIRLAYSGSKDSEIYTNFFGASYWYQSIPATYDLPTTYEPCFILDGDKEKLDFYNLFLATAFIVKNNESRFNSLSQLKNGFCEKYIELHSKDNNIEDIYKRCDKVLTKAKENDIILFNWYDDYCLIHFREMDLNGLDKYLDEASIYADYIIKKQENKNVQYIKNRKVSDSNE